MEREIIRIINKFTAVVLEDDQYEVDLQTLGMDSMDFIRCILEIEKKYNIHFSSTDLSFAKINTVKKLKKIINDKVIVIDIAENDKKLRKLICEVCENVPYYQNMPTINDIKDMPLIDKNTINNNVEAFLNKKILDYEQFIDLKTESEKNYGEVKKIIGSNLIYAEQTSGSSGVPFTTVKTLKERTYIASQLWKKRRSIVPHLKPQEVFYSIHLFGLQENTKIVQNQRFYTPAQIHSILMNSKIRMWHTNLRFVRSYLKYCTENNIVPCRNLEAIELSGLYASQEEKRKIQDEMRCKVLDFYGMIEVWLISYACDAGYFHIDNESVFVELIDEEGNNIVENDKVGRIVVTSKILSTMPFVRYITGDYGKFLYGKCKCGSDSLRLQIVEGRESDRIKGDESKFGNIVFRDVIRNVSYHHKDKYKFQQITVLQNDVNCFKVNVYGFLGQKEELERDFSVKTKGYLSPDVQLEFYYYDETIIGDKPVIFRRKDEWR